MTTKIKELGTAHIRIDGGTQNRVEINDKIVAEYADAMRGGAVFPAVVVFYDGTNNWLADGFHRFHAANSAEIKRLQCEVHDGTKRDAVLFSLGVNDTHGLRRSNADKRKAVETALADAEWAAWSDSEIARRCAVSHTFVSTIRKSNTCNVSSVENPDPVKTVRNFTTSTGKTAQMDISNIGKKTADDADDTDPYEGVGAGELDGYGRPILKEKDGGVYVPTTTETFNEDLPEEPEAPTALKDLTQEQENELSDQEWLAMLPLHQKLISEKMDPQLFVEAALNWRKLRKIYTALRREVKAAIPDYAMDAYSKQMRIAIGVDHPKKWKFSRGAAGGFLLW